MTVWQTRPMTDPVDLAWLTSPGEVTPLLRQQLAGCWQEVANTGGAVGFPFPPVSDSDVASAVAGMVSALDLPENRILTAGTNSRLAGWLFLAGNSSKLTAHWARVLRVQTALDFRGYGVGRALMSEAARAAAEDFALEQLHLELRSGLGLEGFYRSCGWRETGRWPGALRLPAGDRDEVLMVLDLQHTAEVAGTEPPLPERQDL